MNYNFPNLPAVKVLVPFMIGLMIHPLIPRYSSDHLLYLLLLLILMASSIFVRKVVIKSLFLLGASFFLGLFILSIAHKEQSHIPGSIIQEISILQIVDTRLTNDKLTLIAENIAGGARLDSVNTRVGKVLIKTDSINWESWQKGDLILCNGKIFPSKTISNPHAFNYGEYLIKNEVYHKTNLASERLIKLHSNQQRSWLTNIRNYGSTTLEKYIADSIALDISKAMILGMKKDMDKEIKQTFSDTGAIHVLAVSGLHVGIVAGMVYFLFGLPFLHRIKAMRIFKPVVIIAAIWAFALITGSSASVIRSASMFTILTLGLTFKRLGNSLNLLACTALGMLIYKPEYLHDLSFQFSFLALAGIILFFPYVRKWLHTPYKTVNKITSLIAVSIAAQFMVAPISILNFHQFPSYFILSSLLAVPAALLCLNIGVMLFISNLWSQLDFISLMIGNILEKLLAWLYLALTYIESMPFSLSSGLMISSLSAIFLYFAFISFFLFLQSRKAIWLAVSTLFFFVQVTNHIWEGKNIRSRNALFVYNNYRGSYVELFKDGYCTWLEKDTSTDFKSEYINEANIMHNRILAETNIQSLGIEKKNSFFKIADKLLCIYPDSSVLNLSSNKKIDLLTLSEDNQHLIDELTEAFELKLVVLDGTIKNVKYKIRDHLASENISCHITSMDGPYVMEL